MAKQKTGMALPKHSEPKPPPHSKSVDAGYKPTFRGGRKPAEDQEVVPAMAEDRKALYEAFAKTQTLEGGPEEAPTETSPEVDEPEAPPVEEAPESTPATPEPEVEVPGTSPDTEEEKPATKPEEKKPTVPHAALHEEREKHKLTRSERDELKSKNALLERQQADMLQTVKSLSAKVDTLAKPKDEPPAPISDPEAVIRQLQAKVERLEGKTDTFEKRTETQQRETMIQDLNSRIAKTNTELEQEGLKGFNYFLDQVTAEVKKQILPDGSNARDVDVPENWKKVFREMVYPRVKGMFAPEVKAKKIEDKKLLKKEAQLVDTAGATGETKAPEKKEWTFEDYLALQRKNRAS